MNVRLIENITKVNIYSVKIYCESPDLVYGIDVERQVPFGQIVCEEPLICNIPRKMESSFRYEYHSCLQKKMKMEKIIKLGRILTLKSIKKKKQYYSGPS